MDKSERITRITPSLLSSWSWSFRREGGFDDFLKTLSREPMEPNEAMKDGMLFEQMVHDAVHGLPIPADHEWYEGILDASTILRGSAEQVRGERIIEAAGHEYLLVGVADNIKAGVIYDTKLSKRYEYGKYHGSPQHPAYFALWPEAFRFTYLIYNGHDLICETYYPFDTPNICSYIAEFRKYIDKHGLAETYIKNWGVE